MTNILKTKSIYLAIGMLIGVVIGCLSLWISNLFIATASILSWLLMAGVPSANSHPLRKYPSLYSSAYYL